MEVASINKIKMLEEDSSVDEDIDMAALFFASFPL